ncbi:MAG: ABC transporter permease [Bacillota bacterium]
MLFLRMALSNARRNLNRSLLALVGMAVAAAILTGSVSMESGYPREAFWEHRRLVGADILIFTEPAVLPGPSSGEELSWMMGLEGHESDLLTFFPAFSHQGYLAPADVRTMDLHHLPGGLEHPEVIAVEPFLAMPAFFIVPGTTALVPAVLRGRHTLVDAAAWNLHALTPDDDGAMVCLVNREIPPGWPDLSRVTALVVEVPSVVAHGPGGTVYDYTRRHHFTLEVRGTYEFVASATDLLARGLDMDSLEEPRYLHSEQIFVPAATLERIFASVGGTGGFRYVRQLGVRVRSMFLARDVAASLQAELPWARVLTVPQLVQASWSHTGQMPVTRDATRAFIYLSFALAGMLVTTNMLILVTQRRREIGILKAIGASGGEIILMVLGETVVLATLGSIMGFALVRAFYVLVYLASDVTLARAGLSTLYTAGLVTGLSTVTALAAGVIPAVLASGSTAREVLRHE